MSSPSPILPEAPPPRVKKFGKSSVKNIAVVVAAIVGVLLVFSAPAVIPALATCREAARRASCQNNLTQIGLGIKTFAKEHNDEFPKSLNDLYPRYINDPSVFICPASNDKIGDLNNIDSWSSYEVVFSGKLIDDKDLVALQDKNGHAHRPGGRNYLFGDGKVKYRRAGDIAPQAEQAP
jgi:hypothetical protein